jgi:hypothetical protein
MPNVNLKASYPKRSYILCSASLAARQTRTLTISRLYSAEPRLSLIGSVSDEATSAISKMEKIKIGVKSALSSRQVEQDLLEGLSLAGYLD